MIKVSSKNKTNKQKTSANVRRRLEEKDDELSPLMFNIVLKILAKAIRQKRARNDFQVGKKNIK